MTMTAPAPLKKISADTDIMHGDTEIFAMQPERIN